jgi:hypothetical protein
MNSKIYRCGWCGSITDYKGENLKGLQWEKVARMIDRYGDYRTHKVNGWCCGHEFSY